MVNPVDNYFPYNFNNYLYYSPSFRGRQYNNAQTVPNFTNNQIPKINYQIPPDTVSFSAQNKINNVSNTKKKAGLSNGTKWAIGILGTALTCVVAKKVIPPMRVQSRVKRIFLEDFTKEEAKAIQKKYQDILKIEDKDKFIDKLFAELKKDYKLDNIPIKLDKNYKSGTKSGEILGAAHFSPDHSKPYLDLGVDKNFDKENLFKQITHELRHAKQDKLKYQVANREELVSVYKDRMKDTFKNENWSKEKFEENASEMVDELINFYKKIGIGKIDSNNRNYDYGKKILDSYRTYANASHEIYNSTLYETDAKATERLMQRLVNNSLFSA